MKNVLMYDKHSIGKSVIELHSNLWEYDYYNSQSVIQDSRYRVSNLNPIRLIPFDYEGIKFNMISCPAGGKVIDYWGKQERIKEPFILGETEVTQELFEAVMGFNYSVFRDTNKNPVENVTWYDCLDFCNKLSDYFKLNCCYILADKKFSILMPIPLPDPPFPLSIREAKVTFAEGANGFRLPRECEWTLAATAGTINEYAGANDDKSLKRVAWFDANSGNKTHPVAQKLPNEWGFYDMSGNIGEWCKNNTYEPADNNDSSADRVYRGGSWNNGASALRSVNRSYDSPSSHASILGFRVARSI
jgi:sulfatase modifying factor 1